MFKQAMIEEFGVACLLMQTTLGSLSRRMLVGVARYDVKLTGDGDLLLPCPSYPFPPSMNALVSD